MGNSKHWNDPAVIRRMQYRVEFARYIVTMVIVYLQWDHIKKVFVYIFN